MRKNRILAMQEMGMKMAVQMFGGTAADGEEDD